MKPTFFSFKSISISWFMALAFLAIFVCYLLLKLISIEDKQGENTQEKLKDTFFWVVLNGFIGARIMYVILHLNSFISSPASILNVSHYNLSLIGGVVAGVLTLFISSKRYKLSFCKLLDIFSILFYFSMAIGVWNLLFDVFMLSSSNLGNSHIRVATMSLLFLIAAAIQVIIEKRTEFKYLSLVLLILTLVIYYIVKLGLIL